MISAKDEKVEAEALKNIRYSAVLTPPSEVAIRVSSGVAVLSGRVVLQAEKQLLEEIVRSTSGVRSVENHLQITPCVKKGNFR